MFIKHFLWQVAVFVVLIGAAALVSNHVSGESMVKQGRRLYLSHGCAVCHGENADGKSIVPRKLVPPAIDFRDAGAYRYGHDKQSIMTSIKRGAKQPGSAMPAYDHLPARDIEKIAAYISSLAVNQDNQKYNIRVSNAWVRWQPPSRPNTAAFMTIENGSSKEMVVISVSSRSVERIELHAMENKDGIMTMRQVTDIHVPAKGVAELKSGGLHLMLFGLAKPLEPGDKIPLSLQFQDGSVVDIEALVKGPDEQ